jgi:hypothetical protein
MDADTKEFYAMLKPEADRPAHSPLGASSAERWMKCPGSVRLIQSLDLPETDEPDYRTLGTAAHEACAQALATGADGWELIGECFGPHKVDAEMAEAIQVYLDICREYIACPGIYYIEEAVSAPVHPDFYGTADFVHWDEKHATLTVVDYKHGQGITVEAVDNPQLKYYAYGALQKHPDAREVVMYIVQPRGFHMDGPVRGWPMKADALCEWVEKDLVPAMKRTETDPALDIGDHCRFCPAKLVCPEMGKAMYELLDGEKPDLVPDVSLAGKWEKAQALKHLIKAIEAEVARRLNDGRAIPGIKLVDGKANRIWKDGAEALFRQRFGDQAFEPPSFKSPAEMEKIGPAAKSLVHEWAYKPQGKPTVAPDDDPRPAIKVQKGSDVFAGVLADG